MVAELERVIDGIRKASWVLLLASLTIFAGLLVQVIQLLRRC